MVIHKSLTGLVLLALLCSATYLMLPADAAVSAHNTAAEIHDSGAAGSASHTWVMQGAKSRNLSQGSLSTSSKNVTRIVVPAGGAQNTLSSSDPLIKTPTFPSWVWVVIPVTAAIILPSVLVLRTVFNADDEKDASGTGHSSEVPVVREYYEGRGVRTIPIKGSGEPPNETNVTRATNEHSATRIHIDDTEPAERSSEDIGDNVEFEGRRSPNDE